MEFFANYHKYHRITMTYAEAEKYMAVGWTLESVQRCSLRGVNKEIEQCCLVWERGGNPVIPDGLD